MGTPVTAASDQDTGSSGQHSSCQQSDLVSTILIVTASQTSKVPKIIAHVPFALEQEAIVLGAWVPGCEAYSVEPKLKGVDSKMTHGCTKPCVECQLQVSWGYAPSVFGPLLACSVYLDFQKSPKQSPNMPKQRL